MSCSTQVPPRARGRDGLRSFQIFGRIGRAARATTAATEVGDFTHIKGKDANFRPPERSWKPRLRHSAGAQPRSVGGAGAADGRFHRWRRPSRRALRRRGGGDARKDGTVKPYGDCGTFLAKRDSDVACDHVVVTAEWTGRSHRTAISTETDPARGPVGPEMKTGRSET